MAKVSKVQKSDSRRLRMPPHRLNSCSKKAVKEGRCKTKCSEALEKKDLDAAKCSVCLEFPHNAVLLLCSSYDKGCRPYMCATSRRFSNCLEQYKKAYTKVTSGSEDNSNPVSGAGLTNEKAEVPQVLCPLCRGLVKGWTVVEPARKYLNRKRRTCMQENCSFTGTYKELRKHVKSKHPLARPRAVDPVLEEKWKKFEHERERNDVISTIMSSTPGAVVLGDFVIEPGYRGNLYNDEYVSDDSFDDGYFLESFDRGRGRTLRFLPLDYSSFDDDGFRVSRALRAVSPVGRSRASRFFGAPGAVRRMARFRGRHGGR